MNKEIQLLTVGRLAEILSVPVHRITYLLASRPHIKHVARAGKLRLYDNAARDLLKNELDTVKKRNTKKEDNATKTPNTKIPR